MNSLTRKQNLASENLTLFLHCFAKGHEGLQIISIQIITDILITHPSLLAPPPPVDPNTSSEDTTPTNPFLKPLTKTFLRALASGSNTIPLMSCVAASKLLLLGLLPPPSSTDVLKAFTLAYFNPETAADAALRQALSYFLPVFCHSRLGNAVLMANIAVGVISKLVLLRDELDDEQEEMVGWGIVAGMLAEWTDGRKVVGGTLSGFDGVIEGAEEPHLVLAVSLLERALGGSCSRKFFFFSLLSTGFWIGANDLASR